MEQLTWHQKKALSEAYRWRNTPAHILREDYIQTGLALCREKNPKVWLPAQARNKPANRCCSFCKSIADRIYPPAEVY